MSSFPAPTNASRLRSRRASAVIGRGLEWLWPGRFAFGCVHVLDGDPGRGKSTIAFDIAARLTRGLPMPAPAAEVAVGQVSNLSPPAAAIIVSAEDNDETAIQPRLVAANADLERIEIVDELEIPHPDGDEPTLRPIALPDDIELIERLMTSTGARLLIVDPLMSFLGHDRRGRRIDPNREPSIRELFYKLRKLAERTSCCIILIRHLSKSLVASALRRGLSSIGITAASRCTMLAADNPDRPGVLALASVKTNLGAPAPTMNYRIVKNPDSAPRIEWLDECDYSADDLLRRRTTKSNAPARLIEAKEFLRELLKDGPLPSLEVLNRAAERGYSAGTLERAVKDLRIDRCRKGKERLWQLPEVEMLMMQRLDFE